MSVGCPVARTGITIRVCGRSSTPSRGPELDRWHRIPEDRAAGMIRTKPSVTATQATPGRLSKPPTAWRRRGGASLTCA